MALDYASILSAGQSLVPDLQQQMFQRQQQDMQTQLQQVQLKKAQRAEQRSEGFQRDYEQAMLNPTPQAIARLSLKYPEMADNVKQAWELYDAPRKEAELSQMTTMFARAKSGDFGGAASVLRARVEADRAAGQPDPQDEQILAALESDDPVQQKSALAVIGTSLLAVGGKDALDWLGTQDGETDAWMRKYQFIEANYGREAADQFVNNDIDPTMTVTTGDGVTVAPRSYFTGGAGGVVYPRLGGPQLSNMGGGDPTTGGQGLPTVSESDAAMVRNSFGGDSPGFREWARGVTIVPDAQFMPASPPNLKGPIRVRTVQEAMKLPAGTRYITPDGEEYVR